jgi:AcrR family transcriptional regulator
MSGKAGRATALAGPELAIRIRPVQKRAIQTVDLILDTAAVLLGEVGVDAFNTNLLAERAGVAVRSVYRYFPNKFGVIVALYERHGQTWEPHFNRMQGGLADPDQSLLDVWEAYIDDYVAYLDKEAGWAIRPAVQALPQLRDIDRRNNIRHARKIAAALRARGSREGLRRLEEVGHLLLETATAAIDESWNRFGRVPKAVAQELKRMHRGYLAHYVP